MKGLKLRSIVGLFGLSMCGASVLIGHIYKQNTFVRISIDAVKLGKMESQLRNDIALLEVEVGGLKKLSRLEGLAKTHFGLEYGISPVLVYPEGASAVKTKGMEVGKVAWRTREF